MSITLTNLLPHLCGWEDFPKAWYPWEFGYYEERAEVLKKLPSRVWPLVLCEYAVSVLPIWLRYSTTDVRPQKAIQFRLDWCRVPFDIDMTNGRIVIDAFHAAQTALATGSANVADAARAAHAAGSASADDAAYAAYAVDSLNVAYIQWRWMYEVHQSAIPIAWNPDWNTSTVIALAETVWSGDYSAMSILADALEDAGCGDTFESRNVLDRLRSYKGPHTRADVAVWSPLGLWK